jgi:hypothetical protein
MVRIMEGDSPEVARAMERYREVPDLFDYGRDQYPPFFRWLMERA